MRRLAVIAAFAALLAALVMPAAAGARINPQIAGLQVALRAHGLYLSQIDGIAGPKTAAAVHAFQRSRNLKVGVADAETRKALGPLGGPLFGSRILRRGDFGWDVAVLQFLLTRSRVYRGALDGYLGKETAASLRRYQRTLHLTADAVLGPRTLSAIVEHDHVPVRPRTFVVSATTSSSRYYTVRAGDNLTAIAERDHTTIAAIARANKLDPAQPIIIGRRLRIPTVRVARAVTVAAVSPALRSQQVDVRAILDRWSQRLGVDPELTRAVAWMESGYQTTLVSSAGARGVLQMIPSTRKYVEHVLLHRRLPDTVDGNIEAGVVLLKHLLGVFDGDQNLALAAWYQGERAVRTRGIYAVTRPFVADVLALRARM